MAQREFGDQTLPRGRHERQRGCLVSDKIYRGLAAVQDKAWNIYWQRSPPCCARSSDLDEIPQVFEELMRALRPLSNKPAVSDLRDARGNNDPVWEATVRPLVQRLYGMFPALAVLVKTAAGKLHTQRLARERGASGDNVFTEEAEALAYLAARRH